LVNEESRLLPTQPVDMKFEAILQGHISVEFANEILTLVGYGDDQNFYGWVITSRSQWKLSGGYYEGRDMRALAFGNVKISTDISHANDPTVAVKLEYSTFDGSSLTVTRNQIGSYTIGLPIDWFAGDASGILAPDRCIVLATGTEGATRNVAVLNKTYNDKDHLLMVGFHVADYNGNNVDAGFNFAIYNAMQWLNYNQDL